MKMNKKGEETGSAVLWIILGLAAVVIIGLFIYNSFGKISTAIDAQKAETQAAIAHCTTSFKGVLGSSSDSDILAKYCTAFSSVKVEVGSIESYVSCAYLEQQGATVFSLDDVPSKIKSVCNNTVLKKAAYNKCLEYNSTNAGTDKNWKEYVNGVECSKSNAQTQDSLLKDFGLQGQSPGADGKFVISLP